MRITRRLEFDAGHRIPNHESGCRHLHGHRYAIEITLSGDVVAAQGAANQGMVVDFSGVKTLAQREIVDLWDHAFLAWKGDTAVIEFLRTIPDHRTVVFDEPPTAEHLAAVAFRRLDRALIAQYGKRARLERVRIFETPNCWADALRKDDQSASLLSPHTRSK
jgi:6-pyruvoyltetrahydropterin/6-carboxytetrahydropterin synthase